MAKCQRNDLASVILDRPSTSSGGHFRLWNSFSGSSLRRKLFDAFSCGGSSRYRHRHNDYDFTTSARSASENPKPKAPEKPRGVKSEKLSDLLSMADSPETVTDFETKKKEEALEELKLVAKELQAEDSEKRKAAASTVRLHSKEDSEARVTLAMLGAIPPLVGMLDSEDLESQIASLYALLNLGIGNDA